MKDEEGLCPSAERSPRGPAIRSAYALNAFDPSFRTKMHRFVLCLCKQPLSPAPSDDDDDDRPSPPLAMLGALANPAPIFTAGDQKLKTRTKAERRKPLSKSNHKLIKSDK